MQFPNEFFTPALFCFNEMLNRTFILFNLAANQLPELPVISIMFQTY